MDPRIERSPREEIVLPVAGAGAEAGPRRGFVRKFQEVDAACGGRGPRARTRTRIEFVPSRSQLDPKKNSWAVGTDTDFTLHGQWPKLRCATFLPAPHALWCFATVLDFLVCLIPPFFHLCQCLLAVLMSRECIRLRDPQIRLLRGEWHLLAQMISLQTFMQGLQLFSFRFSSSVCALSELQCILSCFHSRGAIEERRDGEAKARHGCGKSAWRRPKELGRNWEQVWAVH